MSVTHVALETNLKGRRAKTSFSYTRRDFARSELPSLRKGCYELEIEPNENRSNGFYDWKLKGTLRVSFDRDGKRVQCSGDSYLHIDAKSKELRLLPFWNSNPVQANDIPIWPRDLYAYYVAPTALTSKGKLLQIAFDLLRPVDAEPAWDPAESSGPHFAELAPDPKGEWDLKGVVFDSAERAHATMKLRHIVDYLRSAHVEVQNTASASPLTAPKGGGLPSSLQEAFATAGWKIDATASQLPIAEPTDDSWSLEELHRTMSGWRECTQLDRRWTYHLLLVPSIRSAQRGIMYDWRKADLNQVPREGAALESGDFFGTDAPIFGDQPMEVREAGYFRSAIHEIGHMMGLEHRHDHNGYMNTTDRIAAEGELLKRAIWGFHELDLWGLQHLPDFVVRPGGVPSTLCGSLDRC